MSRQSVTVHVGYAVPRAGLPAPISFRRWVAAALRGAKRRKAAELSIRIVDADEGRALNRDYRNRDYATNVLSFPVEWPSGVTAALIGDLAICAPVVRREAAEQGKTPREHWAHLTVQWNSACLSRCPRGERPLVELYLEPGVFSEPRTEKLPLRVDFIRRVEFGEVSGHRVLIKRGPGNRGPTECGTTHEATSGMSS